MERNFKRDPKFHEMCIATINDYIKQENAVKITSGKLDRPSNVISYLSVISYLPHHCVSNINKPGSVRVMFNTGAKFENTCPNVNILKEPDLLKKLLSVLLKFREGRYGILWYTTNVPPSSKKSRPTIPKILIETSKIKLWRVKLSRFLFLDL